MPWVFVVAGFLASDVVPPGGLVFVTWDLLDFTEDSVSLPLLLEATDFPVSFPFSTFASFVEIALLAGFFAFVVGLPFTGVLFAFFTGGFIKDSVLVFGLALAAIFGFDLGLPLAVTPFPTLLLLGVDPIALGFSGDFDLFLDEDGGDLEATLVDLVGMREREFLRDRISGGSGLPRLETLRFWPKASGLIDFRRPIIALAGLKEMDFRRLGVVARMLLFLAMVAGEMLDDRSEEELMLSREFAREFPRELETSKRELGLSARELDLSARELDLSKRELGRSIREPI